MQDYQENLTTIFLTDAMPATKIMLLKRSAAKKFAPNLYTGTGGKLEQDESALTCAQRELFEETGLRTPLTEFGRIIINKNKRIIYQFHGMYDSDTLPNCPEGVLEWVTPEELEEKPIIPNAKLFLLEWKERNWDIRKPVTLYIERQDPFDVYSKSTYVEVVDGLLN
jgi:8-oxo-dGTP pyrophosphatase MutT (NUDIX family)